MIKLTSYRKVLLWSESGYLTTIAQVQRWSVSLANSREPDLGGAMHCRSIFFCALMLIPTVLPAADILIGTGSRAGTYFQVGRSICRIVNRQMVGKTCKVTESAGSVENLNNVQLGALEIGLVQSDIQYHALQGSGPYRFVDTAYDSVRSLFSLYSESFTLVVRRDAGIGELSQLKGHRVNIGNPGSGQRATMEVVMDAMDWGREDFQLVTELPASQQSLALCHNRIQALVYTVGHPNPSVARAVDLCDGEIAEVAGPVIERLIFENPYYTQEVISPDSYASMHRPVKTFGVLATAVTSEDVDEELVYAMVKAVFENIDQFRRMHKVFRELDPKRMIREGLSAPLHKGAERYYREQGWM